MSNYNKINSKSTFKRFSELFCVRCCALAHSTPLALHFVCFIAFPTAHSVKLLFDLSRKEYAEPPINNSRGFICSSQIILFSNRFHNI